ncbi:hypothetical protein AcV5_000613 [Taiwanofungus camphoratus]|nr:hypothetical protein AcV5_000613 [Antrodia cinnamomea]
MFSHIRYTCMHEWYHGTQSPARRVTIQHVTRPQSSDRLRLQFTHARAKKQHVRARTRRPRIRHAKERQSDIARRRHTSTRSRGCCGGANTAGNDDAGSEDDTNNITILMTEKDTLDMTEGRGWIMRDAMHSRR